MWWVLSFLSLSVVYSYSLQRTIQDLAAVTETSQSCPAGYTLVQSLSSNLTSWCPQPTSSCGVCVLARAISGIDSAGDIEAEYFFSVILACPLKPQAYAKAYISWYPAGVVNYAWWPYNVGTNWTVTIHTTEAAAKNQKPITLKNEWCLEQGVSTYVGYVGYLVDIPYPS